MSTKPKILFFGTSEFAVPALQALIDHEYEIVGVVTVPDQIVGRKKILTPPPVKVLAQKYHLPIFQPEKLKGNTDFFNQISKLNPEIGVTAAYGKIIPQELLELSRLGIINIHPSLLPQYRGPSPIQTALLNGDTGTGVTILQVDAQVDHGPIIRTSQVRIYEKDDFLVLESRLAKVGAQLLIKLLGTLIHHSIKTKEDWGKLRPWVQDESQATFTKMIKTEDGEIKSSDTVEQALNKIRALNPEPGTYLVSSSWPLATGKNEARLKIFEAEESEEENSIWPSLKLANGYLLLKKVQSAGGKVMFGQDWLRGQKSKTRA